MENSGYILEIGNKKEDTAFKKSKIGGSPNLKRGSQYPKGKENPLEFLLQIDLSELPNKSSLLPEKGMLYFFVDNDFGFYGETKVIFESDNIELIETESTKKDEINLYEEYSININSVNTNQDWNYNPIVLLQNHKEHSAECGEIYLNLFGFDILKDSIFFGKNNYLEYFGQICGPTKNYLEILKPENIFPSKDNPEIKEKWKNELIRFAKDENFHRTNIENLICLLSLKSNSIMSWWDMGHIEFYIMKDDLINLNFEKVKFAFTSG